MLRFFLPLAYNAPFFRGIWNNNHAQLMPFYDIWNTSFLPHPAITLAYYAPFCPQMAWSPVWRHSHGAIMDHLQRHVFNDNKDWCASAWLGKSATCRNAKPHSAVRSETLVPCGVNDRLAGRMSEIFGNGSSLHAENVLSLQKSQDMSKVKALIGMRSIWHEVATITEYLRHSVSLWHLSPIEGQGHPTLTHYGVSHYHLSPTGVSLVQSYSWCG